MRLYAYSSFSNLSAKDGLWDEFDELTISRFPLNQPLDSSNPARVACHFARLSPQKLINCTKFISGWPPPHHDKMASIHPSRMAMVPQSRPAPPPPHRSPTPPPKISREEELKLKLLAKRKQQLPEANVGGLKIRGVSKQDKEEEPLGDIYRDRDNRLRTDSAEPGPSRVNRSRKGSPYLARRDGRDEDDYRRHSRSRSRQDDRYPPRHGSRSRSLTRNDDSYAPRSRQGDRYPRHDDRYDPDPRQRSRSRNRRPNPPHRDDRRDDYRQPPPHLPPFPPKWDQNQNLPQVAPPIRLGFGGPGPAGLGQGPSGPGAGAGYQTGPGRGYGGNGFRNGGAVDFEK
jgi:hypothetical protein